MRGDLQRGWKVHLTEGAAMVMGHSLAQWSKWYDLDFHSRESQQAVDAMATWRDQLLSYTVRASPGP